MNMLLPKSKPLLDPAYLKHVRTLPCILSGYVYAEGAGLAVDPAHLRHGVCGIGMKPGDDLVLPLRHDLHALQHNMGEVSFWRDNLSDELMMRGLQAIAREYYREWRK